MLTSSDIQSINDNRDRFEKMVLLACRDKQIYQEGLVDKQFKRIQKGRMNAIVLLVDSILNVFKNPFTSVKEKYIALHILKDSMELGQSLFIGRVAKYILPTLKGIIVKKKNYEAIEEFGQEPSQQSIEYASLFHDLGVQCLIYWAQELSDDYKSSEEFNECVIGCLEAGVSMRENKGLLDENVLESSHLDVGKYRARSKGRESSSNKNESRSRSKKRKTAFNEYGYGVLPSPKEVDTDLKAFQNQKSIILMYVESGQSISEDLTEFQNVYDSHTRKVIKYAASLEKSVDSKYSKIQISLLEELSFARRFNSSYNLDLIPAKISFGEFKNRVNSFKESSSVSGSSIFDIESVKGGSNVFDKQGGMEGLINSEYSDRDAKRGDSPEFVNPENTSKSGSKIKPRTYDPYDEEERYSGSDRRHDFSKKSSITKVDKSDMYRGLRGTGNLPDIKESESDYSYDNGGERVSGRRSKIMQKSPNSSKNQTPRIDRTAKKEEEGRYWRQKYEDVSKKLESTHHKKEEVSKALEVARDQVIEYELANNRLTNRNSQLSDQLEEMTHQSMISRPDSVFVSRIELLEKELQKERLKNSQMESKIQEIEFSRHSNLASNNGNHMGVPDNNHTIGGISSIRGDTEFESHMEYKKEPYKIDRSFLEGSQDMSKEQIQLARYRSKIKEENQKQSTGPGRNRYRQTKSDYKHENDDIDALFDQNRDNSSSKRQTALARRMDGRERYLNAIKDFEKSVDKEMKLKRLSAHSSTISNQLDDRGPSPRDRRHPNSSSKNFSRPINPYSNSQSNNQISQSTQYLNKHQNQRKKYSPKNSPQRSQGDFHRNTHSGMRQGGGPKIQNNQGFLDGINSRLKNILDQQNGLLKANQLIDSSQIIKFVAGSPLLSATPFLVPIYEMVEKLQNMGEKESPQCLILP